MFGQTQQLDAERSAPAATLDALLRARGGLGRGAAGGGQQVGGGPRERWF